MQIKVSNVTSLPSWDVSLRALTPNALNPLDNLLKRFKTPDTDAIPQPLSKEGDEAASEELMGLLYKLLATEIVPF